MQMLLTRRRKMSGMGQRGFALLTTGMCCGAMFAVVGLAVDVGRMYSVRNENQAYVDSAALAAALQLDGTTTGFARARDQVTASVNRWNMGTTSFTATTVEFSTSSSGPWAASPFTGTNYVYVRVRNTAAVPVYFMPVISPFYTRNVSALAVAGQIPQTGFSEGLFPFSPLAHNSAGPDFGLAKGACTRSDGQPARSWGRTSVLEMIRRITSLRQLREEVRSVATSRTTRRPVSVMRSWTTTRPSCVPSVTRST